MLLQSKVFLTTVTTILAQLTMAENFPCLSRKAEGGYVCVCNSTYCDTIERPVKLPRGWYHHYSTSEENPGFNLANGTFSEPTINFRNISSNVFILVNSSVKYQTLYGFGGGITDSVGFNYNSLPEGAREKFIESFFGVLGIEYTFARIPIACSDFSLRIYTYDDVPGDVDLQHFNLTDEDFTLKFPILLKAMEASERGLKLIASSWTAPSWMKTNNAPSQGYVLTRYHYTLALYFYKFLKAYEDHGINIWAICPGNEPIIALFFGSFFGMPDTIMMPYQAREWTKHFFGPMIKNSEFKKVKLITLDDERPFITWWSNRIFSDKEMAQYIDGIALHWYLDTNETLERLNDFHKRNPDKLLLYTESSINSALNINLKADKFSFQLGDWTRAVRYLNNIFPNLHHWVSSYLDWNIALDTNGGPTSNTTGVTLDSSVVINAKSGEFYKQPIFYVLGHFSKFIPPGSKKIETKIRQDTEGSVEKKIFGDEFINILRILDLIKKNSPPPPPTGKPGPAPTMPPFPTRPPEPPSNTILALASSNPDGSISIIAFNPRTEPVNLIVQDSAVGEFNKTVEANSLNTFIYWP